MRSLVLLLAALLATGCTMEAKVSKEDLNKTITCTDTRDGEVFSFHTNNITNVRTGTSGASFDVVDNSGKARHITKSMEVYIKCDKTEENT